MNIYICCHVFISLKETGGDQREEALRQVGSTELEENIRYDWGCTIFGKQAICSVIFKIIKLY